MKPSNAPETGPAILRALRARSGGGTTVSFSDFMDVALYDADAGYYRRGGPRIGYGPGTDFLTATASPLFGRMVAQACVNLLLPAKADAFEFVEIGAEPGGGIFRGLAHPFGSARQVGVGEPLRIEGPSVVFSNELFDAQPFRRYRARGGSWRELGVSFGAGALAEVETAAPHPPPVPLPPDAPEGYMIDAPLAATGLAGEIAGQPWHGLFLAFDYGKSWEEIAYGTPQGTARAYRRHVQSNDLLAHPGGQDLTCHVCWDWIARALEERGFRLPRLESQEAFFVGHCGAFIQELSASEAGGLSRDKLSLLQLIHPGNMGRKFQALWALRAPA
jgi:SAM-dependent MidA family methyltransferase